MTKEHYTIGARFGRLVIIARLARSIVMCRCDCGGISTPAANDLKSGRTQSCGCLHREIVGQTNRLIKGTHRMVGTPTYQSWAAMKARCIDPNHHAARNYSARGITLCDDWHDFAAFYRDMGERPKGKTLDRIDNAKGYSKENCRWATPDQQSNNTRVNVVLEHQGETATVTQWSRKTGISPSTIKWRMARSWPSDRILSVGVRKA